MALYKRNPARQLHIRLKRRTAMPVHNNQPNPYAQMDALHAAEKAAAKREAARTRKKLSEFASRLKAQSDGAEDCVVRLGSREESDGQGKEKDRESRGEQKQKSQADSEEPDNHVSGWA
jgi:hypothetical protein